MANPVVVKVMESAQKQISKLSIDFGIPHSVLLERAAAAHATLTANSEPWQEHVASRIAAKLGPAPSREVHRDRMRQYMADSLHCEDHVFEHVVYNILGLQRDQKPEVGLSADKRSMLVLLRPSPTEQNVHFRVVLPQHIVSA